MRSLKLLAILLLAAHDAYGKNTGISLIEVQATLSHKSITNIYSYAIGSECNGFCGQGEGDCDSASECLDGLVCEFDGWWGTDYCRAGIKLHLKFVSNCV